MEVADVFKTRHHHLTTIDCNNRGNWLRTMCQFHRASFRSQLSLLFVLVLIVTRVGAACIVADSAQDSYSFSGCRNGCFTVGNTRNLVKLDSADAWVADVRFISELLPIPSEIICHCVDMSIAFRYSMQINGFDWTSART